MSIAMTVPLRASTEETLNRLVDLGERAIPVLLFSYLVTNLLPHIVTEPLNALILVSEGLVAGFIVFRRQAIAVSMRPMDWIVALTGTVAPMLVRPGGHGLAPPQLMLVIFLCGVMLSIWGKLTLRRGFGIAAANRGVVETGAFGFVRHPIYAGYVLTYIFFLLLHPTLWNLCIYLVALAAMVMRIRAEERILAENPAYAAYMTRVRYRLVPGFF
jgi:protein-S-isoprenylcysteine O-methyltransferase Ste14